MSKLPKYNILILCFDRAPFDWFEASFVCAEEFPILHQLARQGVRFRYAYTNAPETLAAGASLWTGLFPASHGATTEFPHLAAKGRRTLPGELHALGYRTAAFVPSGDWSADRGFAEDIDDLIANSWRRTWVERAWDAGRQRLSRWLRRQNRQAQRINLAFFRWLDRMEQGQPFFAVLHYPADAAGAEDLDSPSRVRSSVVESSQRLQDLVRALEQRGRWENTLLAICAVRGCAFDVAPGASLDPLSEPVVRIPFLLRVPAPGPAGFVVEEFTQLTDLAPTLLWWAGATEERLERFPGRVLLRGAIATNGPEFVVVEEYRDATSLTTGKSSFRRRLLRTRRYRFVWKSDGTVELYDVVSDPRLTQDLAWVAPNEAVALQAKLFDWLAAQDLFQLPVVATASSLERMGRFGTRS